METSDEEQQQEQVYKIVWQGIDNAAEQTFRVVARAERVRIMMTAEVATGRDAMGQITWGRVEDAAREAKLIAMGVYAKMSGLMLLRED